ncbi:MAG: DUF4921 family protein [bacterium]|nr:DUF4921 family protein [bacterium]
MEISELRRDIVSGAWVVIATGRGKRPHDFLTKRTKRLLQPKRLCPFERPSDLPSLIYDKGGRATEENWWVQVVPNKYPAFGKGICAVFKDRGPYEWTEGVGFHDLVISRDHIRSIGLMTDKEAELVFRAYQARYLALKDDACVEYVSIFHNHGPMAGASIAHPHSQIIAIPVVPPDIAHSLKGSSEYAIKNDMCVHCVIMEYEIKERVRIIYENERFVVVAPYASKSAFEMRVYPKRHGAHFEAITDTDRLMLANAMRVSLAKLHKGLKNPDFNFFLHTAPTGDSHQFDHYHWHFEIIPKTAIWAGFEIGTGIEISTIAPETAAEFLRGVNV